MPPSQPRRVPWTSPLELAQVHSWIYSYPPSPDAQHAAVRRIKAWLHRGSCPHAVEATCALLECVLGDEEGMLSAGEARLMYGMALVRFVNGLVDPLQTSHFARSIGTLAASLQLPHHFVALRHAATHEDLPTLPSLRSAAREALAWLDQRYWVPATAPPSMAPSAPAGPSQEEWDRLRETLREYKALRKEGVRDKGRPRKAEVGRCLREVERWVAGVGVGMAGTEGGAEEEMEKRAVEYLVSTLWEAGGLVPRSKKKRSPNLPPTVLSIWAPLLTRLDAQLDSFSPELLAQGADLLCGSTPSEEGKAFLDTVGAWMAVLLSGEFEVEEEVREGVVRNCLLSGNEHAQALLQSLAASSPALASRTVPLLQVLSRTSQPAGNSNPDSDTEAKLQEMEDRLASVHAALVRPPPPSAPLPSHAASSSDSSESGVWRRLVEASDVVGDGQEGWRPCPIGCWGGEGVVDLGSGVGVGA